MRVSRCLPAVALPIVAVSRPHHPVSELQIRCGARHTLNPVKATRFEPSPMSEPQAAPAAFRSDRNGECTDAAH
uniref:Transcriptional regulator n=1 Tax=Pseudomonas putida TaxID=303 RepID=A0A0N9MQT9_PSEPU|nr:transcriptional regulator [Pseudomonas putida]